MNKVFAFVGPKGGGKDTALAEYKDLYLKSGYTIIETDFSDGIRAVVAGVIYGEQHEISNLDERYLQWKNAANRLNCFEMDSTTSPTGRDMLIGVGETMKQMFGQDIWAKYCELDVKRKLNRQDNNDKIAIFFGSTRFIHEAATVIRIADYIGAKPEFMFCNYNHAAEGMIVHASEKLAQYFVDLKIGHRQDITNQIVQLCKK